MIAEESTDPIFFKESYEDNYERRWYTLSNGVVLPSSTSILGLIIPPRLKKWFQDGEPGKQKTYVNWTQQEGYKIEQMITLDLFGKLEAFEAKYEELMENWKKKKEEHNIKGIMNQRVVWSQKYGYAGRLDIMGYFEDKPAVFDIKSGFVSKSAALQLASYGQALKETTKDEDYEQVTIGAHRDTQNVKIFATTHKRECFLAFLDCLQIFKHWNFAELTKMGYPYLEQRAHEVFYEIKS